MNAYRHKKRIKIAYIVRSEEHGGVEEHVLSLVKNINRNVFKPFIVGSDKLLHLLRDDLADLDVVTMPIMIANAFDYGGMIAFFRFLRTHGIDIVNTHMFITSLHYTPIAWLARVPVLLETSHGVEKWRLSKGFWKRQSFVVDRLVTLLQTRVLAVSGACRDDLKAIKKIPGDKISVILNGRDLREFTDLPAARRRELRQRWGLGEDEFVFGVMARLDFQKGHGDLLEAVRMLLESRGDFKVLVVGDGALRGELESRARHLGLDRHVIFTGFQSDIRGYHGILDVDILPSHYEGLPLGLIEASAMARPVIATRVDGTPEVVVDGETGLLVAPRDPRMLANAMGYALAHREEMEAMGVKGRAFVQRRFPLGRQVRETEALYLELMAKASSKEVRAWAR